jgi:hypothetical protein
MCSAFRGGRANNHMKTETDGRWRAMKALSGYGSPAPATGGGHRGQFDSDLTAAVVHSVDVTIGQTAFDSPYERRASAFATPPCAMTKAHSQREPAGADEVLGSVQNLSHFRFG